MAFANKARRASPIDLTSTVKVAGGFRPSSLCQGTDQPHRTDHDAL